MNNLSRFALALFMGLSSQPHAEVGETETIDAIASKPDSPLAVLLIFQPRPWNPETLSLLEQKANAYRVFVTSGQLVKQRPALATKKPRVIVAYANEPNDEGKSKLVAIKDTLAKANIECVWGSDKNIPALASQP